jgi:trigger factor
LQPITQGNIDTIEYQPGTDLTFNVDLEVRPEVELERVGGFTVMREQPAIGDQQVDEVLQRLRDENALWQPREDATPSAGDMATVEITPLDSATSAEPSKPRQYQIVIGEDQALPAVEDAIRTLKAGEEGEFDVALPEDPEQPDGPTLQHRMHIRMLELKSPQLPEVDDAFASSLGDFDSLDTLRARIREDLGREASREAERAVRGQLVQQIVRSESVRGARIHGAELSRAGDAGPGGCGVRAAPADAHADVAGGGTGAEADAGHGTGGGHGSAARNAGRTGPAHRRHGGAHGPAAGRGHRPAAQERPPR